MAEHLTWTPPPGHWSRKAEEWAEDRDTASWREVAEARRLRRDLALYPHQARQTGKETDPHG